MRHVARGLDRHVAAVEIGGQRAGGDQGIEGRGDMRGKAGVKRHERPFGESAALYRKTGVGSNRPKIDTMNSMNVSDIPWLNSAVFIAGFVPFRWSLTSRRIFFSNFSRCEGGKLIIKSGTAPHNCTSS